MKKWSLIFCLSFIIYIPRFFIMFNDSANLYIVKLIFMFVLLYQLSYIIYFRKKESVSLQRAITLFLLYTTMSTEVIALIYYGNNFFNGYTDRFFIFRSVGDTFYGSQAIIEDIWAHVFFVPALSICVVYQLCYYFIGRSIAKKNENILRSG